MVFRIEKNSNYTVMSNYHLRDKDLSLKAKGLLSWMLSNNDDWDYSIAGIVACCKEGETTINTVLQELQEKGYVTVKKIMPNKDCNRIHYEYFVYEYPQGVESQGVESLGLDFQGLENQGQINTNKRITNKRNTNIKFIPPSIEEVQEYCKERGNYVDAQRFIDFYQSKGWMVGKNKMKDWKACIRNWERNVKDKVGEKTDVSNRSKNRLKDLEKYYLQKVDDD